MPTTELREAIESFHCWRRDLLLAGHEVTGGEKVPDPELVLASKMLKVFVALHPECQRHIVQLQIHFVKQDYTSRVDPKPWRELLAKVQLETKSL